MKLGGVILASLGIIIVVLVAQGRWATVWAAALGNNATGAAGTATGPYGVSSNTLGGFGSIGGAVVGPNTATATYS